MPEVAIAVESPLQAEVEELIRQSDAYLSALYPPESRHAIDLEALAAPDVHLLVARLDGRAVGCVGFALGQTGEAEVKRLFVVPETRGRGIGRALMAHLERRAAEADVSLLQLETGVKQPEALALYRAFGYVERGPFGAYRPDPLCMFMEKRL
jgi:putative acetyltransferase